MLQPEIRWLSKLYAFLAARKMTLSSSGEIIHDEYRMRDLLLQNNSRWFIRLRWLVIACFPILAFAKNEILGLHLIPTRMFFWLTLLLIICNIIYCIHHQTLEPDNSKGLYTNIWLQVIVDLLVITVLVHMMDWRVLGGIGPMLYLPHLVLACIMLNKRNSFVLVIVSISLYMLCILLTERGDGWTYQALFRDSSENAYMAFQVIGIAGLFIVTWYLMSHLAEQIQQRDAAMGELHRSVRSTFESSKTQMYHTAHQMKSPVVAIQSLLELYKYEHGAGMDRDITVLLEKVDLRCESLLESVSDMLFLAKLKSGQTITWNFQTLKMNDFIQSIVSAYTALATKRAITLTVDLTDFTFVGDPDAMGKMLDNLVSNAIRYSNNGGEVTITCAPQGRYYVLKIKDQGIGIKKDHLSRIFDPHFRSTEAKRHCRISTGMGLSIVKEVASFHGININVESEEGTGTCFTLMFPKADPMNSDQMPLQHPQTLPSQPTELPG